MQTLAQHLTEAWRGRKLAAPGNSQGAVQTGRVVEVRIAPTDQDFIEIRLDTDETFTIIELATDTFGLEPFGYTEPATDGSRDFDNAISFLTSAQLLKLRPRLTSGQHRRYLEAAYSLALRREAATKRPDSITLSEAQSAVEADPGRYGIVASGFYAPEIIVAEVSKSWRGEPGQGNTLDDLQDIVSKQFELVIAKNRARGYRLAGWQFRSVSYPDIDNGAPVVNETIIATFEKVNI